MQESGGKPYEAPLDMNDKKEMLDVLKSLDPAKFCDLVARSMPELGEVWKNKTDAEVIQIMHMLRAQHIALGEDFYKSRNFLRVQQFGYTEKEASEKPFCADCKWLKESPEEGYEPCLHMGSVPQDIACRAYEKA